MKTKKPSAIIYNWYKQGEELLQTSIYSEEGLYDEVLVYSLPYDDKVLEDFSRYEPDIIISFEEQINIPHYRLRQIHLHIPDMIGDYELANKICQEAIYKNLKYQRPRFSVFTPVYKTGERIKRTYESLKNQTWTNWEWVVVDDSPDEETWKLLKEISITDYRVKLHRIYPLSGEIGRAHV